MCLSEAIEPPATTNFTPAYGTRLAGLWRAALEGQHLSADGWCGDSSAGPSARSLLRRARWAALGVPYDWTVRSYDTRSAEQRPVPAPVRALSSLLAASLAGTPLRADVALVNLYGTGDTLSCHVDDAEGGGAEAAPIVSFSLGCPAVFLLVGVCVVSL